MNLQHIEIVNFRCFERFSLAVHGDSLTVVAPNAGGKSSLLTAIAWAVRGPSSLSIDDFRDREEQLIVIATVGGLDASDHGEFVEGSLRFNGPPTVRIGVRATWDAYAEEIEVVWGFPDAGWRRASRHVRAALSLVALGTDRDAAKLTRFDGSQSLLAALVDEVGATTDADTAADIMAAAAAGLAGSPSISGLLSDLQQRLAAMMKDAGTYEVAAADQSTAELLRLLELRLAHEGPAVSLRRQSSGLAQLTVAAALIRLLEARPGTLLLYDEPELSLHPQAQRALAAAVTSTSAQALVATHSASVLAESDVRGVVALRRSQGLVTATRPGAVDAADAHRLRRFMTPLTTEAFFAQRVIFVEGITDYQAVRIVAATLDRDLDAEGIAVVSLDGAGSLSTFLQIMGPGGLDLTIGGICDADYESDWCQNLTDVGLPAAGRTDLSALGFYVSDLDLEDELVAALGTTAAQLVFSNDGASGRFHTYTRQPAQRGMSLHEQIRSFAQKRKAYWTPRLAASVTATSVPASIKAALDHA